MKRIIIPVLLCLVIMSVGAMAETVSMTAESIDGEVQALEMREVVAISDGKLTIVEGTVYKEGTFEHVGAGLPVEVRCIHGDAHNVVMITSTNAEGFYSAYTYNEPDVECVAGDQAYIIVLSGGVSYTSEPVTVATEDDIYDYASVNKWIPVPEFTAMTAALSVLGVLAFAAYKRRK